MQGTLEGHGGWVTAIATSRQFITLYSFSASSSLEIYHHTHIFSHVDLQPKTQT